MIFDRFSSNEIQNVFSMGSELFALARINIFILTLAFCSFSGKRLQKYHIIVGHLNSNLFYTKEILIRVLWRFELVTFRFADCWWKSLLILFNEPFPASGIGEVSLIVSNISMFDGKKSLLFHSVTCCPLIRGWRGFYT